MRFPHPVLRLRSLARDTLARSVRTRGREHAAADGVEAIHEARAGAVRGSTSERDAPTGRARQELPLTSRLRWMWPSSSRGLPRFRRGSWVNTSHPHRTWPPRPRRANRVAANRTFARDVAASSRRPRNSRKSLGDKSCRTVLPRLGRRRSLPTTRSRRATRLRSPTPARGSRQPAPPATTPS